VDRAGVQHPAHLAQRRGVTRGGRPLTVTEPLVGSSRPRIIRMVVDFPAPFGPRKPVTTPGWTVNVRSETAVVAP